MGAKVRLVSHVVRVDSRAITKLIKNEGITATYATPTEYKSWLRRENESLLRISPWRLALVAGEAITESLLQLFRQEVPSDLRFFNVYGPTETTCGSIKMELMYKTPNLYPGTIPVGRASANECFYILDENLNLMPVCQTGEIAIGGVGVAHGYLNNEEQTRAAFRSDPFASEEYLRHGWNRMYRTGDVGYLKPNGTLILKGRIGGDTEVKINCVRVDLRDIEQTVLKSADGLFTDALASLRLTPDGAAKFIVAHVVPSADKFAPQDEDDFFTQFLSELPLPRPICPSAIIPVANFPRTVAGKIDRKAMAMLSLPQKLSTPSSNSNTAVLPRAVAIMCDLWEAVIPQELMNMHHLNSCSDFFTVGGSSILLIELQHKIRQQLGVSIPLLQLFQSSQLGVMAQLLDTESSIMDASQVDWNAETELIPLIDGLHAQHQMLSGPCRTIILTGGTGFLGQHLLEALCMQQQVEKTICIAVRGLDEERRALLSAYSHKVEYYEGDLKLPRLGLTEEAASQIFSVADAVVHNGADVSHLKTYSSLRAANLTSTKELTRLCSMRKIPLHYISTTGVTMYTTLGTWAEVSVRDASPPTRGLYGYVASKWASEVYLENAQREYELPVYIHRPSRILRPSSDTREENPTADVVQNLMEYSRRIGAVPKPADAFAGYIDLVRPETVTRMVIDTILSHNYDAPCRGIVYQHQSGDVELEVNQLRDYLAAETAKEISELPLDEWIKRAENAGLSLAMATVFRATLGGTEKMNLPRLLRK
ncbi:hypothetical protein F4825DRAFT_477076 [Nemania diffusa]|nr:hypothetical protein F4825DRAFT_477076 [Nemania diffusa]